MPKTKFQEFIFTFITSGCMIFIMGVYNVARTSGCYLQTRTAFFPIGMVHRASLCILHCQQNVQILRIPRGKINWPTNLHHPLHPDLHRLHNGTTDEPAWNHRIFRNHFKSHLHLAPDHLPELHHSLPTADPGCRTILQIRIPSPVRISKSGKWR